MIGMLEWAGLMDILRYWFGFGSIVILMVVVRHLILEVIRYWREEQELERLWRDS